MISADPGSVFRWQLPYAHLTARAGRGERGIHDEAGVLEGGHATAGQGGGDDLIRQRKALLAQGGGQGPGYPARQAGQRFTRRRPER